MKFQPLGRSEHDVQCAVVMWAALQAAKWPALKLLFAIPNGAHLGAERKQLAKGGSVALGAIRARKLKAEGMRPGVPDLCLPVACGGYHGLFVEMKTESGKVRPEQEEWIEALREQGYCAVVARGDEEARAVLLAYVEGRLRCDGER
jgi:hypothetical protein